MGYFKRTLRRSRCAAEVRAALVENPAPEIWLCNLLPLGESSVSRRERFFRLTSTRIHPHSHEPLGVFRAAKILEEAKHFSAADRDQLRTLFDWFNRNLPRPRNVKPATIFWFRSDAGECASRIWEIAHLLRAYGVPLQTMWTRRPGWIEYCDAFQIGAIPFSDRAFHVRRV